MNFEFLKDVLGSPWQIEPRTLNSLLPILRGMTMGIAFDRAPEPQNNLQYAIQAATRAISMGYYADDQEEDSPEDEVTPPVKVINVLPVRSVLTKHDQDCGPRGTRTLAARLLNADSDENVIGHILVIESGGGAANAVPEMTEAILKCTKPVIAWIDGMAASAAYYIACYCKEIIASRDMDFVGSIGTMARYESRKSKSPENEDGEVAVTIYADGSEEKNEEFELAINEFDFTLVKERILNPFNAKFVSDVSAQRPQVQDTQLHGRTYFAQDVVGSLVDSIGEFSTAIDRIIELASYTADPIPDTAGQSTHQSKIEMRQFTHLNNVLNVEVLEASEEGVFLNEEQLTSIEQRIEANQQLVTERDNAVQELATANTTLETVQATIATAYDPFNAIDPVVAAAETPEAKAEAIRTLLASRPAAIPIQGLKDGDEPIETGADWETIDNLPHNKLVDANI